MPWPSTNGKDIPKEQVDNASPETSAALLPRVLIASEHASARFGGEACLPWHYFRLLRRRGVEAWLVVHSRTKAELLSLLPSEAERMHFLPDTWFNKLAHYLSRFLPHQLANITFGYASRIQTQWATRKLIKRLVVEKRIDVVHQPIPVSPREPSLLFGLGVPVVMGPMNGNMSYPPGFSRSSGKLKAIGSILRFTRHFAALLHRIMPGKLRAEILLVANDRTREAIPANAIGKVLPLVENGVDFAVWRVQDRQVEAGQSVRFIFLGRLVDWKAVDLLLEAFAQVDPQSTILEIVGDGPMRQSLEKQSVALGLGNRVWFHGWQPQTECARLLREGDVLVLPSIYECGGAVVLEAMACAKPVIATEWGGPTDYIDHTCGVLVPPTDRDSLIAGFKNAMNALAADQVLRRTMGQKARERVERLFDWEIKIDSILTVYQRAMTSLEKSMVKPKI